MREEGTGNREDPPRAPPPTQQEGGSEQPQPHQASSAHWTFWVLTESRTPGARSLAGLKAQVGPVQVGLPRYHGEKHRGLGTHASHRAQIPAPNKHA